METKITVIRLIDGNLNDPQKVWHASDAGKYIQGWGYSQGYFSYSLSHTPIGAENFNRGTEDIEGFLKDYGINYAIEHYLLTRID